MVAGAGFWLGVALWGQALGPGPVTPLSPAALAPTPPPAAARADADADVPAPGTLLHPLRIELD